MYEVTMKAIHDRLVRTGLVKGLKYTIELYPEYRPQGKTYGSNLKATYIIFNRQLTQDPSCLPKAGPPGLLPRWLPDAGCDNNGRTRRRISPPSTRGAHSDRGERLETRRGSRGHLYRHLRVLSYVSLLWQYGGDSCASRLS